MAHAYTPTGSLSPEASTSRSYPRSLSFLHHLPHCSLGPPSVDYLFQSCLHQREETRNFHFLRYYQQSFQEWEHVEHSVTDGAKV